MSDFPTADEIRRLNIDQPATTEEVEKFVDFALRSVSAFIFEHVSELQAGKSVNFEFPAVRDMGESRSLWNKHYEVVIAFLRRNGYWCKRYPHSSDVVLEIALRDDKA